MLLEATPRVVWESHFIIPARKCWSQDSFLPGFALWLPGLDPIRGRIASGAKYLHIPTSDEVGMSKPEFVVQKRVATANEHPR
jgi:hypothetical protein